MTTRFHQDLLRKLIEYGQSNVYPFHMPGHKRQHTTRPLMNFPNPFSIDITEVEGFDNLHHPEGILKNSMDWAAEVYRSDKTYYLINGSSSGILSAISGSVNRGGAILMARNCHKSAYHGALLGGLEAIYLYPDTVANYGIQGGVSPDDVAEALQNNPQVQAVMIVSPTYDGVVSDIHRIAEIVHHHNIPLIVDEAHGAHFSFAHDSPYFPDSSIRLGADIVIQSVHKTLPSLTQTAVMHVKKGFIDVEKLERYTQIYQSSSPSYVLLASIEQCIAHMAGPGQGEMVAFGERLLQVRKTLSTLQHLRLVGPTMKGLHRVYDLDPSKIVISTRGFNMSGAELDRKLRQDYDLEMEMCGVDYATAILTLSDTREGLARLCHALHAIDATLSRADPVPSPPLIPRASERRLRIAEAIEAPQQKLRLSDAAGRISAEFAYVYPPGIPVVVPGEILTEEIITLMTKYRALGLPVQGMRDKQNEWIFVTEQS